MLAAGVGSRFGGGKLLAPWRGGILLDAALATAFAAPVRSVVVVWGADEGVRDAAQAFADRTGEGQRLRLVCAEAHAAGLSQSLRAGVESLPDDASGVFVFLGDMPRIPVSILTPLAEAVAGGALTAAPVFEGRRGHPVLFSRALFADLTAFTGDRGAGVLLGGLGDRLVLLEAPDDGVLFDVDRPGDLQA